LHWGSARRERLFQNQTSSAPSGCRLQRPHRVRRCRHKCLLLLPPPRYFRPPLCREEGRWEGGPCGNGTLLQRHRVFRLNRERWNEARGRSEQSRRGAALLCSAQHSHTRHLIRRLWSRRRSRRRLGRPHHLPQRMRASFHRCRARCLSVRRRGCPPRRRWWWRRRPGGGSLLRGPLAKTRRAKRAPRTARRRSGCGGWAPWRGTTR
jgi:hypothetical protein